MWCNMGAFTRKWRPKGTVKLSVFIGGLMRSGKLYKNVIGQRGWANCDKLKLARPIFYIPLCPFSLVMIRFLYSRLRPDIPSRRVFWPVLGQVFLHTPFLTFLQLEIVNTPWWCILGLRISYTLSELASIFSCWSWLICIQGHTSTHMCYYK